MKTTFLYKLMLVAALLPLSMAVWAQYNPENPAEPQACFWLTTTVSPSGAGWTSGSGLYAEGTSVWASASPNSGYTFSHWELKSNGDTQSTSQSFIYVTGASKDTLVAVFNFAPANPAEPDYSNQYRLYLTSNIEGACSFNRTSGDKVETDEYVYLTANISYGYQFLGWYQDGTRISESTSFMFLMPASNTTLQAVLSYNPSSPDEPPSEPYIAVGDVNADGVVNAMDATMLIGAYLNNTTDQLNASVADVNHDGIINVMDATEIINIYLHNR